MCCATRVDRNSVNEGLSALQRRLQHNFGDPQLLLRAITHRSFSSDHNERLEFLGDSVLNLAVAALLYQRLQGAPEGDLSRVPTEAAFLDKIGLVARHTYDLLKPAGFMALVIGDKYVDSRLVPLGFMCMQRCTDAGFVLKAINIKEILNNERGKGKNGNLWKYRALVGGFYLFKHEYVMIFRKPAAGRRAPKA